MKTYNRSQFAKVVGVAVTTLITWEKKGILVPEKNPLNGRPVYTEEQKDYVLKNNR